MLEPEQADVAFRVAGQTARGFEVTIQRRGRVLPVAPFDRESIAQESVTSGRIDQVTRLPLFFTACIRGRD